MSRSSVAARGCRAGRQARPGRRRGRRSSSGAGLALAGRRRLQLAGDGRCPAARRARGTDAGRRRAADPGDAARDAGRRGRPADVRRREPAVRRRSGSTGSALDPALLEALATGGRGALVRRGVSVERVDLGAGRAGPRRSGAPTARRRSPRGSSSGPTAPTRSSRGPRGGPARSAPASGSGSPTTSPIRGRTSRATRGCASSAAATSGSRRSPVAGSTSGSCSVGRGASAWPATAPGPSRPSDRGRRPADATTTPRPGGTASRATTSPAPRRSATA